MTRSKVYVLPRQYGGPDKRGNSRDRKRRREWLIENWRADVDLSLVPWGPREVPLGEGEPACRCYRCGDLLTVGTVTADRRVPGVNGGTYRQDNIRPACFGCNASTGGAIRGRRAA